MKPVSLVCLFALIASAFGGACLTDYDTGHSASAWNTRLYSYNPSSAASASTSSDLVFMSYNLQSGISVSCKSNVPTQASLMTSSDYVGTQETVQGVDTRCNCNIPQTITSTTGKSERFLMTIPFRTGQYGIAAGTSQKILDTKYFLMTYAGVEQRGLIAVKTQPAALGGKSLWFISTHVEYYVWAARQSQVQQLISWVRTNIIANDAGASVVVVGDFNAGPDDTSYTTMKGLFKDAWEVFKGTSSGGYTYPAESPSNRFDHIWYYTPSSVTLTIKNVEIVDNKASDHRPLKATFNFKVAGATSAPTAAPTAAPTKAPTAAPTKAPTAAPTAAPTKAPTKAPTSAPTPAPTKAPTSAPTPAPTSAPTKAATSAPTPAPTSAPSSTCSVSLGYDSVSNAVTMTNTGSKAIKSLTVSFSPSLPSNSWNFVATGTSGHYTLPDWAYQTLVSKNQEYKSSGYWTAGAKPTATVVSVSC